MRVHCGGAGIVSVVGQALILLIVAVATACPKASLAQTAGRDVSDPRHLFELFRPERQVASGQAMFKGAAFVGSEACKGCHAKEHGEWQKTWHAKMEQWPSDKTVLGDFNDRIITYRDIEVKDKAGKASKVTFQVKTHKDEKGYFFTVLDRDDPANNQTFKIAKTLGGKWDQGYEIQIGENYYPAILRYSVKQNAWLVAAFFPQLWVEPDGTPDGRPRRVEELPMIRTAEAKCAGCHTSGFTFEKDKATNVWKAHGQGELGVGCEKCHGPASEHVKAAKEAKIAGHRLEGPALKIVHGLKDLDHNQQTQLCAQCHGRSTNRKQTDLTFPQGFLPGDTDIMEHLIFWTYQGNGNPDQNRYFYRNDWAKRNRQQWQDFTKSTHFNKAGLSCLTCHTFHGKWEDMHLRKTPTQQCESCHAADRMAMRPQTEMFRGSKMEQAGVRCIDCHMARIGFRSHLVEGTHAQKHYPMDGSSHTFHVATPLVKKQFGVRSACEVCHTKERALPPHVYEWVMQHPMSDDELHGKIESAQNRIRALLADAMAAMGSVPKKVSVANEAKVAKARANIDFVKLDGSTGFHNPRRAEEMLAEALRLIRNAGGQIVRAGAGSPAKEKRGTAVASLAAAAASGASTSAAGDVTVLKGGTKAAPVAGRAVSKVGGAGAEAAPGEPVSGAWYISREGDNLWRLSAKLYGSGTRFERIYKANAERMSSPHYLPPGTRIWLPE